MTSQWRVVDKKGAQTVELDHEYALQKIREAIASYDWTRSTAEAYVSQILQSLLNSKGWRLDRPETLLPYIQAANLPIDGDLERALSEAWGNSRYFRCSAYDAAVLDEVFRGGYIDANDSNLLLGIISSLGDQENWTRNLRGSQELAEQQRIQRRQRWIAAISINGTKTQYPLWRPEHGQVRYYDCSTLEGEDDANLEALSNSVSSLRAQLAGATAPRPQASTTNDGLTSNVKPQNRLAAQEDEFLAHPLNPEREYTATEIKKLSPDDYRRLVFVGDSRHQVNRSRSNAINRILRGEQFKG